MIKPNRPIAFYDQCLDPARAAALTRNPAHRAQFQRAYQAADDVFAVAGEAYLQVFDAWLPGDNYIYDYATGGIGQKLHQLKYWLRAAL